MKLNLGCCAKPLKGYVNIDVPPALSLNPRIKANIYSRIEDLTYLPNTVEDIRMEAVFEHFPRHRAMFLLRRFYRWLQIGGWVSIIVPDLIATIDMIKSTKSVALRMFYFRHIFGPKILWNMGFTTTVLTKKDWNLSLPVSDLIDSTLHMEVDGLVYILQHSRTNLFYLLKSLKKIF